MSNNYGTNTNNVNIYLNSINGGLNSSYQDFGYRKPTQIYCKSPNRYNRKSTTIFGSPKLTYNNVNKNNPYDYFENNRISNASLTGMNSMTNIHNYTNMANMNNSLTYNKNYYNYHNPQSINNLSINLEDLMILEEKLSEIIKSLNRNKIIYNECFEWWNYYYNCSLYGTIEKVFKGEDSGIVQSSINYELLTIMICYDISYDQNNLSEVLIMVNAVLNLNHKNLLIICEYILSKISNDSLGNTWVYKLKNIVSTSKNNSEDNDYISYNGRSLSLIEKIKYNTSCISNDLRIILKNYTKSKQLENLVSLYKTINDKSYEEINKFFRENIMRVENPNASVLASVVLRENSNFYPVEPPYLKTKNLKNYTLVLDLDETIIHFKVNPNNDSEGVLRVRPGIFEFLETLGKYYEIIVFTAATQDYADLLIDAIEENKIYFDYRLYRQHAVIIDNDFVKDLTRLGRPIDKMIIVDNMPQNFRLQKENGINIRAFWGEDPYDTALIDLMPILVNIANDGGDVRFGLAKYRNDILKKVTSNISKHDDYND
jgi:CTD small phosphatase-like protein 2